MTGLPLKAALPAMGTLLLVGAVAIVLGDVPVPSFNGVSALLRAVNEDGALQVPSLGILAEALVPAATSLTFGALVPLVAARYLGEVRDRSEGVRAATRLWRPLLVVGLGRAIVGGGIVLVLHGALQPLVGPRQAYLFGSVTALVLSMTTWLAEAAVVLERLEPIDAFRRSVDLFLRRVVHGSATFLVAGLFALALGVMFGLPLLLVGQAVPELGLFGDVLAALAEGLRLPLTALLLSGGGTLLYLDRRVEGEELGRHQLEQEVADAVDEPAN